MRAPGAGGAVSVARVAIAAAALAATLAACARRAELVPPQVRWGEDVCAACNMIVSEERHASAAAVDPGDGRVETRVYDDTGCLLDDEAAGATRFLARWVHDLEEVRWIAADSAIYVVSPTLVTPMGSGVAAFADRARADAFAGREDGEVLDWALLAERARTTGLLAPPPAAGTP